MFGDLFGRLLEFIHFLWPLQIVKTWERAIYYEGGTPVRVLGPGLWPYLPWFTAIHAVTVVPDIIATPRLDITLSDGAMLTFAAEADYVITDVLLAVNSVNDYHHRVSELLGGVMSEALAEKSAADLEAGMRGRMLSTIVNRINKETETFGVTVRKVWPTTFVLKARTFRLLGDATAAMWG